MANLTPTPVDISNIAPDYSGIRNALFTLLSTLDAWKGDLTTQTGTTLIDFISTVGSHLQLKALRYAQDFYPETALSTRALYSLSQKAGLRINRKSPCMATVSMTSLTQDVSLPAYTQISGGGNWFIRESVYLPANLDDDPALYVSFNVYQGEVIIKSMEGSAGDMQIFITPESAFTVSNEDTGITVNDIQVEVTTNNIYEYKNQRAVQDLTLPSGNALFVFGSGIYGYVPSASDRVEIRYVVTDGSGSSGATLVGGRVSVSNQSVGGIQGSFISNSTGGVNEESPKRFRTLAPAYFGSNGTAVTRSQYYALALGYPGVVDVYIRSQREIDPSDFRLMNVVRVSPVLADGLTWSPAQYQSYLRHLEEKSMYAVRFELVPNVSIPVNISLNVYTFSWANNLEVESAVRDAVQALFVLGQGSLGYDITLSDILEAAKHSHSGVDYVDVIQPTTDLIVSARPLNAPTLSTNITSGSLPAGTYSYAISLEYSDGTFLPAVNWSSITLPASGSVVLNWPKGNVPPLSSVTISKYYVWGRGANNGFDFGKIATITSSAANTYTWSDTSQSTPGARPPLVSNVVPSYLTLAVPPVINVQYSTRGRRVF